MRILNDEDYAAKQEQERVITIHRVNIKHDIIEAFKDPSIVNANIKFEVIDAKGNKEK